MWLLFLLAIWIIWESKHYSKHHQIVSKWRKSKRLSAPIRDAWNVKYQTTIPDAELHLRLSKGLETYENGTRSVLLPHYKPLAYYGFLRGAHETSFSIAKYYGWTCGISQGVWFWERGTGPTLLFLHGFGFGPYAYGKILQDLSKTYHVVAPQYPGLSYDGRDDIPLVQDYARIISCHLGDRQYSIVSNSFGTIVHHALLRELGSLAVVRVKEQVYVEPVCFYPYAGQLFSFVEISWRSCLAAPSWRAKGVAAVSYLLVAKDRSTLYLCQQILEDPKWDGEVYLGTIPSTVVLSEHDTLIRVPDMCNYFLQQHPKCRVVVVEGSYHGEALFSPQLKIEALLIPHPNKDEHPHLLHSPC